MLGQNLQVRCVYVVVSMITLIGKLVKNISKICKKETFFRMLFIIEGRSFKSGVSYHLTVP